MSNFYQTQQRLFSMAEPSPIKTKSYYKMGISSNNLNSSNSSTTTTTTNSSYGLSTSSSRNIRETSRKNQGNESSCVPASDRSFSTTISSMLSTSEKSSSSSSMTSTCSTSSRFNRLKWWQKCKIRQSVSLLEKELEHIISESPLLQQNNDSQILPIFHRSEIITGCVLGSGGFSDVLEVIGFQLDERVSNRLTIQQQKLREDIVMNAIDPINGEGRYAIKQLQSRLIHETKNNNNLREFEFAASDLAVEIAYLSRLNHPNILAIRGLPYNGIKSYLDGCHDSYFFLCDRLIDTLDQRINNVWNNQTIEKQLQVPTMTQKVKYALQLADALKYLHQNRIIFRDLKPQNIGFAYNQPNQLILFDFGLCRELPVVDNDFNHNNDYSFEMSGVGTRRYMAPEVAMHLSYNLKADVYSWSMIFWEILTNMKPYAYHTVDEHMNQVCQLGHRPILFKNEWSISIQNILKKSWSQSTLDRLTMEQVHNELTKIINVSQPSRSLVVTISTTRECTTQQYISPFYQNMRKPFHDGKEAMSMPFCGISDFFDIIQPLASMKLSCPSDNSNSEWKAYTCDTKNDEQQQQQTKSKAHNHDDTGEGFEIRIYNEVDEVC